MFIVWKGHRLYTVVEYATLCKWKWPKSIVIKVDIAIWHKHIMEVWTFQELIKVISTLCRMMEAESWRTRENLGHRCLFLFRICLGPWGEAQKVSWVFQVWQSLLGSNLLLIPIWRTLLYSKDLLLSLLICSQFFYWGKRSTRINVFLGQNSIG